MSWQAYVDDHLLVELSGGRKLSFAAIVGLDGGIWAQSEAFPDVTTEQLEILIAAFEDETTLQEKGVHLGEQRYFAIQGEPGSVIRGKHKTAGFTAKKTNQAVILGGYSEGVQPGECNMLVENVADELLEDGY